MQNPDIEAVYIPLPNHLYLPWSVKSAQAGKHVLRENPIGLNVAQMRALLEMQAQTGVRIQEAFMVHTRPQWRTTLDLATADQFGPVRAVMGNFTYYNTDPGNIRNVAEFGDGALLDVGCYLVYAVRRVFGSVPQRVFGSMLRGFGLTTDSLTSAVLDFGAAQCGFTCSTRVVGSQRLQILGERIRLEIEILFNPPAHTPCRIFVNDGRDPSRDGDEAVVD